ncbi:MAG: hypothetical protein M1325_01865 [Actinobacteria bacterium]|nr:hypothetical protein [Actinomycetota bacterium]
MGVSVLRKDPVLYSRTTRPVPVRRRDIGEALRTAWNRVLHKQFLFVYPLLLGLVNALAFFAVYAALGGPLDWSAFAEAHFAPWAYLQEHQHELLSGPLPLAAATLAGLTAVFLAASIRAPYFHAITGREYPKAPRTWRDVYRLAVLYLMLDALFYLVPAALRPGSDAALAVGLALLFANLLFLYADYAVVFEGLSPVASIRRSVDLLLKNPLAAFAVTAASYVLWTLVTSLYGAYYSGGNGVFVLFPLSQMLAEAFVTVLLDTFLIFIYDYLTRT